MSYCNLTLPRLLRGKPLALAAAPLGQENLMKRTEVHIRPRPHRMRRATEGRDAARTTLRRRHRG